MLEIKWIITEAIESFKVDEYGPEWDGIYGYFELCIDDEIIGFMPNEEFRELFPEGHEDILYGLTELAEALNYLNYGEAYEILVLCMNRARIVLRRNEIVEIAIVDNDTNAIEWVKKVNFQEFYEKVTDSVNKFLSEIRMRNADLLKVDIIENLVNLKSRLDSIVQSPWKDNKCVMDTGNFIRKVKRHPEIYAGEASLEAIYYTIRGFVVNNYLTGRANHLDLMFKKRFDRWVKDRVEKNSGEKYEENIDCLYYISRAFGSEAEGINAFFVLCEEFIREVNYPIRTTSWPLDLGDDSKLVLEYFVEHFDFNFKTDMPARVVFHNKDKRMVLCDDSEGKILDKLKAYFLEIKELPIDCPDSWLMDEYRCFECRPLSTWIYRYRGQIHFKITTISDYYIDECESDYDYKKNQRVVYEHCLRDEEFRRCQSRVSGMLREVK